MTSPPYNNGTKYRTYKDRHPKAAYLAWCGVWIKHVARLLKPNGSFFLNVGASAYDPWLGHDVAEVARRYFKLQNQIIWVKSVSVGDKSYGHFSPHQSRRYLTSSHETIYHFTLTGDVEVDRSAIGVPYVDPKNAARFGHGRKLRCRGNVWFLPYETVTSKSQKFDHPATFPVDLAEMCLKLHGLERCDHVLDPFGGVGTTAVACERLRLGYTLIELDERYSAIARQRAEAEAIEVERQKGLGKAG